MGPSGPGGVQPGMMNRMGAGSMNAGGYGVQNPTSHGGIHALWWGWAIFRIFLPLFHRLYEQPNDASWRSHGGRWEQGDAPRGVPWFVQWDAPQHCCSTHVSSAYPSVSGEGGREGGRDGQGGGKGSSEGGRGKV